MATRTLSQTDRPFGVEQEHFILHADGTPPDHSEMDDLYSRLRERGFRTRGTDRQGRILSVETALPEGDLVVCNDACTHILEVAFPVFSSLELFRNLYVETWDLLQSELLSLGLRIHYGGVLEPRPGVAWRPKETDPEGTRMARFLTRSPLNTPLFHRDFPAWFAATHVSLTIPDAEAYRLLPHYYALEFLSPLAFSNSREFQGVRQHCIRPLAWMENYSREYPLVGVPLKIPTGPEEYDRFRQLSVFRDHSFVAVRGQNRLEFRSTCSQNTIEDVIDAIMLRLVMNRIVSVIDLPGRSFTPLSDFCCVAKTGRMSDLESHKLFQEFYSYLKSDILESERLIHRFDACKDRFVEPMLDGLTHFSSDNLNSP